MTPDLPFTLNPTEPVAREAARQFARRVSGAMLATPSVLGLLALFLIERIPEALLTPWLVATLVLFMLNITFARLLLDQLDAKAKRRALLKAMTAGLFLEGLVWGAFPFILAATREMDYPFLGILPLCVLVTLAVPTLCLQLPHLCAFAVAALFPVGVYKLVAGSGLEQVVGITALAVLGLSLVYGRNASRRGMKHVRMKVRNDLLVTQLTHSSADLRTALRRIRQLSTRDPLTQCYNSRALMDHLGREMLRQDRDGQAIGILLVDVDSFKQVNDLYGHLVGDELLKALTDRIQGHLRGGDLLARYGGEEFICIVMADNVEKLAYAAERVRQGVAQAPLLTRPTPIHVTVSIGAILRHSSETAASLLARADHALRQAKDAGRNCVDVEIFPSLPGPSTQQSVLEFR